MVFTTDCTEYKEFSDLHHPLSTVHLTILEDYVISDLIDSRHLKSIAFRIRA
jgi:hypothetical protein